MRRILCLALLLTALPAEARKPPKGVRLYSDCVLENFRHPGAETSADFDGALDIAKSMCGNLRPAAVADIQRIFGKKLARGGDDLEMASQAYLDISVDEQAASIWAEKHPEDDVHGR